MEQLSYQIYYWSFATTSKQHSSNLNPWEGDGENHLGNQFQTHEGKEGHWEQSAWVCKGENHALPI